MAKQTVIGFLPSPSVWKTKGVSLEQGFVILQFKPKADVIERLRKEFVKIDAKNNERFANGKDEIELEVSINVHYAKRSNDQNSLIWALNTIRAEVLNREAPSLEPWTAEKIHERDMAELAPKSWIKCDNSIKETVIQILNNEKGVVKNIVKTSGTEWSIEVWETTRFWDSKRANEYITAQIDELASMHVTQYNDGDLDVLFKEIEAWRKKEKLTS